MDFKRLVVSVLGAREAEELTIHSYRAALASALVKARAGGRTDIEDSVIQALERWKTTAAMRRYGRLGPQQYAEYVAIGTTTDAGNRVHEDVPKID